MVIRTLAIATAMVLSSVAPAHAKVTPAEPKLTGWICVDSKGVHRSWRAAFDGQTYCKLIHNPALTMVRSTTNG